MVNQKGCDEIATRHCEREDWSGALASRVLVGTLPDRSDLRRIIADDDLDLPSIVAAAYRLRKSRWGRGVKVQVLTSARTGGCMEDCRYCAQSRDGEAVEPREKDHKRLLEDARAAYEGGAYCFCMVYSGRGADAARIHEVAGIVRDIKRRYDMRVCVSAGIIDGESAAILKAAGVDRYNHNVNTSASFYKMICTSHSYDDRIATLDTARKAGLELCSGVLFGLGESVDDIVASISELSSLGVESVPINFFIPVEGHRVTGHEPPSPERCLRILCAFRFALPKAEIRIAAGRELHLRSLQALSLFVADSLFAEGYLTCGGDGMVATQSLIEDCGLSPVVEERAAVR